MYASKASLSRVPVRRTAGANGAKRRAVPSQP
jgi:hypothetical protein